MRRAALLLALLFVPGGGAAQEPAPITRIEAREMRPDALARRLFGDMAQILIPYRNAEHLNDAANEPLGQLTYLTGSRMTNVTGVCSSQLIALRFGLVDPQLSGLPSPMPTRNSRTRPAGIDVTTFYFVIDPAPDLRYRTQQPRPTALAPVDCYGSDPRRVRHITADSPEAVRNALLDLLPAVEAARAGSALVPLVCGGLSRPDGPAMTEADCVTALARLEPGQLIEVEGCYDYCVELTFPERRIRIRRQAHMTLPRQIEIEWVITLPQPAADD